MGYPIPTLLDLQSEDKDWYLVLLLDQDRHMSESAASQMLELLTDFDEDSGGTFDFYLPGYSVANERGMFGWFACVKVARTVARIDRLGDLNFSQSDFRRFYKDLERCSPNRWRYSGGCELLLFRRNCDAHDRESYVPRRFCLSRPLEISDFFSYNLDDIVCNGHHMQEFVRQLCNILEEKSLSTRAQLDWSAVKYYVDKIYYDMIMPREGARLSQDQLRMSAVGRQHLDRNFPCQSYVFISHSTKDVAFALTVRDELESRGVRCWMAPRDIPGGTNYACMIASALGECGMLLFLLSHNSMNSVWCTKEILYRFADFQREKRIYVAWCGRRVPLLPAFDFTLTDVQIDGSRNARQITDSIVTRFFGNGLANAEATDTTGWVRALQGDATLLSSQAFVGNCPWDRFSANEWLEVLKVNHNLCTRIRFDLLTAEDSARIISRCPELANRCDWERIAEDFPWGLTKKHPGLIQYFPQRTAGASAWVKLLRAKPDCTFVDWQHLTDLLIDSDWVKLIVARTEFAGKFQHWDRLSRADWRFLLSRRPEIEKYCDAVDGWAKLDVIDWEHVIRHVPEFASKRMYRLACCK